MWGKQNKFFLLEGIEVRKMISKEIIEKALYLSKLMNENNIDWNKDQEYIDDLYNLILTLSNNKSYAMFSLKDDRDKIEIQMKLPENKTNEQMLVILNRDLQQLGNLPYGKDVYITGRCTLILMARLVHHLSHICKKIYIFDPKENKYILAVSH